MDRAAENRARFSAGGEEDEEEEEDGDEEEEIRRDCEAEEEEEEGEGKRSLSDVRCVPTRPRRVTTRTPTRVQRFVLHGPGQAAVRNGGSGRRKEAFMTHLPDSPPRGRASIFRFIASPVRTPTPSMTEDVRAREEEVEEEERSSDSLKAEAVEGDDPRPEVDESRDDSAEEGEEEASAGPHAVDLASRSVEKFEADEEFPMTSGGDDEQDDSTEEEETEEQQEEAGEEDYRQLLAARARFEAEQHERDLLRADLASYVDALTAKRDEHGERIVEFPRNFAQIVSLMTARDIRGGARDGGATVEATKGGGGGGGASGADAAADRHKSWSQILIHNSLAKQQAYGTLDESDAGSDGDGSLAAKIALKMARIRQLDAVLEGKLGRNLYAAVPAAAKKATRVNPQEPEVLATRGRPPPVAMAEAAPSVAMGRSAAAAPTGATNYVTRNRKVLENGARSNLTREEEQRIKRLLRASTKEATGAESAPAPAEFRLDDQHKLEIDRLIAEKRGAYPSAVIMALDDVPEDDQADEPPIKHGPRKPNVVQDANHERRRRQRLQRIEEELRFLQANESVPILPDNDDDDASDGCASERSYMTATSRGSTASTRSGVTRRQLDQFVATEVTKADSTCDKASRDAIESLLRSLSHVATPTTARQTTPASG